MVSCAISLFHAHPPIFIWPYKYTPRESSSSSQHNPLSNQTFVAYTSTLSLPLFTCPHFRCVHFATFQPSVKVSSSSSIAAMDSVMALGTAKPVVIFTKNSLCCMSHSIKTLISSYGASPTVYELDEMPNGEQMEKALPILGCPNLPAYS
ncbi:Monothiol glutaredoxin-S6 [Vitis vinifera]|uniref:Monothiol glutaredoxin-S6 n=1 Tax=Vitis vinifera TaxID=29760 RepID=A0A438KI89_VITVI|nr:Monothiol glutaredoxin-S6 [Vitis vinifera]